MMARTLLAISDILFDLNDKFRAILVYSEKKAMQLGKNDVAFLPTTPEFNLGFACRTNRNRSFVAYLLVLAKKYLDIEPELDKALIGISTALKPYQVAWHLAQGLGVAFKREDDLELLIGRQKQWSCFQKFSCTLEDYETSLFLVANAGSAGVLIPEYAKTFDYFLLYDEIPELFEEDQLLRQLRKLRDFSLVMAVRADDKLRSKQHLVF